MLADTFRLLIEENNGHGTYVVVAEFEILVNGEDKTTGAVASASATLTTNIAAKAIDNNKSSHWTCKPIPTPTDPQWLQFVLPFPIETSIIDSYSLQGWHYTNQSSLAAKTFHFQYFDGSDWITLDSQTEQTEWARYEVRTYTVTPAIVYEIASTISESLAATDFNVRAYDIVSGELRTQALSIDGTYSLLFANNAAVMITCSADEGNAWSAEIVHALDEKVFPTDPVATPYYFKCTQAGTTGDTEPVFPQIPGDTVTDNAVIWQCVERLIEPISQGPLVPQAVT